MMSEMGDKLLTLENPMCFDNGKTVAFTIKTVDGKKLRINCPISELGDIFSFLGQVANLAGGERTSSTSASSRAQKYLAPIPAEGIGIAAGTRPGESVLTVRLSGFDMAFSVECAAVVRLADDFVRASRTLPGTESEPQN